MLEITHLGGFGVAGGLVNVTRPSTMQSNGNDTTSYTFSSQSLGAAADDREIVVCVSGHTAPALPSSVTLGGTPMTRDAGVVSSAEKYAAVYRLAFPTGTTATVAVTLATASGLCAITLYRMTGRVMPPDGATSSGSTSASHTANVYPNGSTIICGSTDDGTTSVSGFTADQSLNTSFSNHRTGIKTGSGGTITITGAAHCALASVAYG